MENILLLMCSSLIIMYVLTGAAAHLLDHNDAKKFLLHKRVSICVEYQEHVNEEYIFPINLHEECCNEVCDTEELREAAEVSTGAAVRTNIYFNLKP